MIKIIILFNLFLVACIGSFVTNSSVENPEMTMCISMSDTQNDIIYSNNSTNIPFELDPNKSYTMPLLGTTPKGEVMLSWTEKDTQGVTALCVAFSKDNGKTFGDKKTVFSSVGVSNSRMMRAKVMAKNDGSLIAVFSLRPERTSNPSQAQGGRGGGRSSNIVFCTSKDGGNTWTSPTSVDSDPKQGIVRGFFDAVILPNDEIAVAYLKDVVNSTKHEERDLRLVISKNGEMQPEKLIDPVVCDCCPISLLVDKKGNLNVFYRDNNNDIRDIARVVSADNGVTFSKSQILHDDKWEIKGCPHSGASSVSTLKEQYITWFSGTQNTQSGIRLVNSEGKLLKILDTSAKNSNLTADDKQAILTWEQPAESGLNSIFYTNVKDSKVADNQQVKNSIGGQNASALLVNGKGLIAYEVLKADKKTEMRVFVEE